MKDRITKLYALLLSYQYGIPKDVLTMPWTSQRLSLANAELKACRAGNTTEADAFAAKRQKLEDLLPSESVQETPAAVARPRMRL